VNIAQQSRIDALKQAAVGRERELVSAVGGVPMESLTGPQVPCPICGGNTKFRWDDKKKFCVCNTCFDTKNGDFLAAVRHFGQLPFWDAVKRCEQHLGISNSHNGHASASNGKAEIVNGPKEPNGPATKSSLTRFRENSVKLDWHDGLAALFCLKKPGINAESLKLFHAEFHRYRSHGRTWPVVALPIWGPKLTAADPIGYTLYNQAGGTLPTGKPPQVAWVKIKTVGKAKGIIGPVHLLKDAAHLCKCEGPSDALSFFSLPGRPDDHISLTNADGAKGRPPAWVVKLFTDKPSTIISDNDAAGQQGAQQWAEAIITKSDCRIVTPPPPAKDLRDWLNAGAAWADLSAAREAAGPVEPQAKPDINPNLKLIRLGRDEQRVVDETIIALSGASEIYQRGGSLCHVVKDAKPPKGVVRDGNPLRIIPMQEARIKELLSTVAAFEKVTGEDGETHIVVTPPWIVKAITARGQWDDMPAIEAVTEVPVLKPDGTILCTPGLDRDTGVFYRPQQDFLPVDDHPSEDDAGMAARFLLEAIEDFPFKTHSHRAAAIAGILTPFARYAFEGPAPLMLVDANCPGTGKGLLVDAMTFPFSGRKIARMPNPKNDEECRKKITSIALAGEPMVLIDNVSGPLGCGSLDAALTATTWSDRKLSLSEMTGPLPLLTTWYATVNNAILTADIPRRSLHIRLESKVEKPEERDDFKHPDLMRWVRRNRVKMVHACLAILRSYFAAGCPSQNFTQWGSFEGWSKIVRGAVVWAALHDPFEARRELSSQADRESQILRMLIDGWQELQQANEGEAITVAQALETVREDDAEIAASVVKLHPKFQPFRNALAEISTNGKPPSARAIGMKLHHLKGRIIDGKYLDRRENRMGAMWSVSSIT
jgi:hypothetical protein